MTKNAAAIVDIGSNSVRLVVYAGAARAREPIYNEKVLAGLGKSTADGSLPSKGRGRAIRALRRFRRLIEEMRIKDVRCVATAAVRAASDGAAFVREVKAMGLPCTVLSEEDEARLAGLGVLYGIPGAQGIAADLGGGSLELVEVLGDRTGRGLSLPIGVLKVEPDASGRRHVAKAIRGALKESGIESEGRKLYLVGGSWRALARIDMALIRYPLPITHQYRIGLKRTRDLAEITLAEDPRWTGVAPPARHATAPAAAMLLDALADELRPGSMVVSSAGIREGLLYESLKPSARQLDPLIEAARERGSQGLRFGQHGDQLDAWMAALFADDPPKLRRLRLASCLLADVAWQADAAFRAERAIETALHGNWFGIDARGRVLMAQALSSSFGTSDLPDPGLDQLCSAAELTRAHLWGLAIRLGQRLSGGVGSVFDRVPLTVEAGGIALEMRGADQPLASEAVAQRLEKLAEAMGMASLQAA